jgi:hypothetical protein
MARLGRIALLTSCVVLASCGGSYFVGFVSNPGGASSVSGIVSAVQSGFQSDPTGLVTPFTQVTFIKPESAITIIFCGDQTKWFPLHEEVQAEFTSGISCNRLLNVVVETAFEASWTPKKNLIGVRLRHNEQAEIVVSSCERSRSVTFGSRKPGLGG